MIIPMNTYLTPPAITPEIQAKAKAVQQFAFENRETLRQVRNRTATLVAPPGDAENYLLLIPFGYRVAYTIEQDTTGWLQIISIMVTKPKMEPSPGAVATILRLFGITEGPTTQKGGILNQAKSVERQPVSNVETAITITFPFDVAQWQKTQEELCSEQKQS